MDSYHADRPQGFGAVTPELITCMRGETAMFIAAMFKVVLTDCHKEVVCFLPLAVRNSLPLS